MQRDTIGKPDHVQFLFLIYQLKIKLKKQTLLLVFSNTFYSCDIRIFMNLICNNRFQRIVPTKQCIIFCLQYLSINIPTSKTLEQIIVFSYLVFIIYSVPLFYTLFLHSAKVYFTEGAYMQDEHPSGILLNNNIQIESEKPMFFHIG